MLPLHSLSDVLSQFPEGARPRNPASPVPPLFEGE